MTEDRAEGSPLVQLIAQWRKHAQVQRELVASGACLNPSAVSAMADANEDRADELEALVLQAVPHRNEKDDDPTRQRTVINGDGQDLRVNDTKGSE